MTWSKGEFKYEGKAKRAFAVADHPEYMWMEFKDSLTAFNGEKTGSFQGKGAINNQITSLAFKVLKDREIPSHFVEQINTNEMVCDKLKIIPIEVVVRNRLAGSTAKKFGLEEGSELEKPLVEFYYKNDALGDPFISDDQALMLKAVEKQSQLEELKDLARKVNAVLIEFFAKAGMHLIDFKLEFGFDENGQILLGDEITPDTCRLWDQVSGERMDKDRFRRDLGQVEENYQEVLKRLRACWE